MNSLLDGKVCVNAVLSTLCDIYREQNHFPETHATGMQLVEKIRDIQGNDSQQMSTVLHTIGNIYISESKYKQAIKKFKECVRISSCTKGSQHVVVMAARSNIATCQGALGQWQEAFENIDGVVKIMQETLDEADPMLLSVLCQWCNIKQSYCNVDEAILLSH